MAFIRGKPSRHCSYEMEWEYVEVTGEERKDSKKWITGTNVEKEGRCKLYMTDKKKTAFTNVSGCKKKNKIEIKGKVTSE